jgi:hypothetical protein
MAQIPPGKHVRFQNFKSLFISKKYSGELHEYVELAMNSTGIPFQLDIRLLVAGG